MRGLAGAACALAVAFVGMLTLPVSAVPLGYEPFNYTIGANLKDQPGWVEPGGATDTVLDKIRATSLAYPAMTTTGNSLRTGGQYSFDDFVGADDNDPGSYFGGDSNTFWFSFLIQREVSGNGGTQNPDYGGLLLGSSPNPTNNVFIGKPGAGASDKFAFEAENGSGQQSSGVTETLGDTTFLVLKMTFHDAGPEDLSLYVNPAIAADEGLLVSSATGQLEIAVFNDLHISTGVNARWVFDEIRVGTTYLDVAVPEPSFAIVPILLAMCRRPARSREPRPNRCIRKQSIGAEAVHMLSCCCRSKN